MPKDATAVEEHEMTATMTETATDPEAAEDQIAGLEAQIADLNRTWLPFKNVQPVVLGSFFAGGNLDPSRLIAKFRIGTALDAANIALEAARAEQARRRLLELGDSDALAALDAAVAATAAAAAEARAAAKAATEAAGAAFAARARRTERTAEAAAALASAEHAGRRWERELEKDRGRLEGYEGAAAMQGAAT